MCSKAFCAGSCNLVAAFFAGMGFRPNPKTFYPTRDNLIGRITNSPGGQDVQCK